MSDDPVEFGTNDPRSAYFDRSSFITSVVSVVGTARKQSVSSVFGLIGRWGSGKTSLIASILPELEANGWRTAHFNPWLYSDLPSLQLGFFSELRDVVPAGDKWNDSRLNIERLRNTVLPLARLASFMGPNIGDAVQDLLDPNKASTAKLREVVSEQLSNMVSPVLIVVDDLDRLTTSELLETFKLVRFVGRIPNVYYLLCYDETTMIDMLEKTDLVGRQGERRALDYLEKIIQLRFDIPPLRTDHIEELFERAVRALAENNQIPMVTSSERRLAELVRGGLLSRFDTPRALKHFFAQLESFLPSVSREVDFVDFVLLTWIRTFEPKLYALIQKNRRFLLSGDVGHFLREADATSARTSNLDKITSGADLENEHRAQTVTVLRALFPVVDRVLNARSVANLRDTEGGRIADDFYFDRFFHFGVPSDDLPDAVVQSALRDLLDSADDDVSLVETQLAIQTGRTIAKLERYRDKSDAQTFALCTFIMRSYSRLPRDHGWSSPRERVSYFLSDLLLDTENANAEELVRASIQDGVETAFSTVSAVRILLEREVGESTYVSKSNERGRQLAAIIVRMLPLLLSTDGESPVFELDADYWPLLFHWQALDPSGARKFVDDQIGSDTWSQVDVLGRLVSTAVLTGTDTPSSFVSDFDPTRATNFIDLTAVRSSLSDRIAAAGDMPRHHSLPGTPQNRIDYALSWLKANPGI